MLIKPVYISSFNANCTRTSSNGTFKGNICNTIPELNALLKESKMFYKKVYHRPTSIVNIPDMSPHSVVIEDSLPLGFPHLLLFYDDKFSYSLAEKCDDLSFYNDFKTIFNTLKQLYPTQNIIFFEHGSGSKNIDGNCRQIDAGKSVTLAHGHFCVMPQNVPSKFEEIMSQTKFELSKNNWKNIENPPIIKNESITNSYAIFKNFSGIFQKPPYIAISEFEAKNNRSKSVIFVQRNEDAETPSQCVRKILSEVVYGENNSLFWDWKNFFGEVFNENKSNFIKQRIEQVRSNSVDFAKRLKQVQ